MPALIDITAQALSTSLTQYLQSVLPTDCQVIKGQVNRVSSPLGDYVEFTAIARNRLATNVATTIDTILQGSISGTTLTVTSIQNGPILLGNPLIGVGISAGTTVTAFLTGSGGVGTYTVSVAQTYGPGALYAGLRAMDQATEIIVQIDVHGPGSPENAQVLTTVLRDESAVQWFSDNMPGVAPLYADDAKQIPFITAEQQFEERWIVEAHFEAHITVSILQEFADQIVVTPLSVDATYPVS